MLYQYALTLLPPPESVAAAFGITRNNVDQIKRRLVERLQRLVSAMTEED